MHAQVKIAELPIDMFRMMLSLEWSNPSLELHEHDEDGSPAEPLESGACITTGHNCCHCPLLRLENHGALKCPGLWTILSAASHLLTLEGQGGFHAVDWVCRCL
eukprot:1159557-Pelagomonas_calceolata.AAC.1